MNKFITVVGLAAICAADDIQDRLSEYIDAQLTARDADDSLFALLKEIKREFDAVNRRFDRADLEFTEIYAQLQEN